MPKNIQRNPVTTFLQQKTQQFLDTLYFTAIWPNSKNTTFAQIKFHYKWKISANYLVCSFLLSWLAALSSWSAFEQVA
jgi:hypothetical protein